MNNIIVLYCKNSHSVKYNNVMVTLNRATIDGEKLWSMLHEETEGNTTFNIAVDTPLESSLGGPISGWFEINANADENVEVMI